MVGEPVGVSTRAIIVYWLLLRVRDGERLHYSELEFTNLPEFKPSSLQLEICLVFRVSKFCMSHKVENLSPSSGSFEGVSFEHGRPRTIVKFKFDPIERQGKERPCNK